MKRIASLVIAVVAVAGVVAFSAPASGHADGAPAPNFVTEIPQGYRDWQWVSSAHEAGNLNSLGAVLGNDVAINAFRAGKLPYPDGTIIVALHYHNVPSEENNKVFGQAQSFVPGAPTNIQFMVKDSTKYAATGGWGFGHFQDGKPADAAFMKLLPLPREGQSDRPCLYSLRTLTLRTTAERNETMTATNQLQHKPSNPKLLKRRTPCPKPVLHKQAAISQRTRMRFVRFM